MELDPLYHPYPSQRNTVYARNGMVATSQPLAAQAGLDILKNGGNAVDAAIATAACLTVVEPTSNGIGGDAFALVWMNGAMYGLNSSGPAPRSISIDALDKLGIKEMPEHGWIPVTVPGQPAAWAALSKRFGRLPLATVLQPAIDYAENGYPVSPTLGRSWGNWVKNATRILKGEQYREWFRIFAPEGRAPGIGEMWRCPDQAATLRSIAHSAAESFYQGELAERMDGFSKQYGGFLAKEDLMEFQPEWVEPVNVNYRGYDVWELPPNGQGIVALIALNILKGFDFAAKDTVDTYHKHIEAMKLAFADGLEYIADTDWMNISIEHLLSETYGSLRRSCIKDEAQIPFPGAPSKDGTVYLAAADREGNMVSYIQSNYAGSGLVVPGTGISLHNRGHSFSLDPSRKNCLEPGKRPYHTIIPGFVTKNNEAVGPFGVMGRFMQPQGHVQVITNTIDFHLNPQAALDAPRWQWLQGNKVELERGFPAHIAAALERKGHEISWATGTGSFGYGQVIWRNERGVLSGGTEPRTDGAVAAW